MKDLFITIGAFIITLIAAAQNVYTLDKNHTKIEFVATHFGISHVEGRFKNFAVTMKAQKEDFTDAVVEMTAEIKSIDTDIEARDNDLRSDKWFDADKYPMLSFKSVSFKKTGDKTYKLNGNITIHGITKPISFDVIYNGKATNPMSKKSMIGFTITGKLNREDFSLGTGGGSSVVGNEIELISNAEFIVN